MPKQIEIEQFLKLSETTQIIDVRSPGEFSDGHIPGAVNIPIFTNEERAIVGTAYKKQSKEIAVIKGLDLVGPKLAIFAKKALKLAGKDRKILVHCWRGGMRSGSMAWLFSTIGIESLILKGGYKAYRNHCLDLFNMDREIKIVGGYTGSGKTVILHKLRDKGEQIIDLEGLANHKGSAFGALGQEPQPKTEQFSNLLAKELATLDPKKTLWLEDECAHIGKVFIPQELFSKMKISDVIFLNSSHELRTERLMGEYTDFPPEMLKECITKITKRLGGLQAKMATASIESGELKEAVSIALKYYDKSYKYDIEQKIERSTILEVLEDNPEEIADTLIKMDKNRE